MEKSDPSTSPVDAFCLGCGYSLRTLVSDRCPECGRAFDLDDPRTVSLGFPLKRWQRWLLRPAGWLPLSLALLGTLDLLYLGGWPHLRLEPGEVLLAEFHYRPQPTLPATLFYAAVLLWGTYVLLAMPRWIARGLLVPRRVRRSNLSGANVRRLRRVLIAAVVLSLSGFVLGWQNRIGREWVAEATRSQPFAEADRWDFDPAYVNALIDPRVPLPVEETGGVFGSTFSSLHSQRDRLTALSLLSALAGHDSYAIIERAVSHEHDPELLVWEIRMLSLYRNPNSAAFLIAKLGDDRSQVRAAAADAVGILRHPSYSILAPNSFWITQLLSLDTTPVVPIRSIIRTDETAGSGSNPDSEHDLSFRTPIVLPVSVRATLQTMMTQGSSTEEREAAARTLVDWPPEHYQLRLAEWGVWIDHQGRLSLAKSILDEIPPFVHRTGNRLSSFHDYFLYPSMVTKPIIHLTTDAPLAVDLEAHIRQGRPWFAYPRPDDFGIGVTPDGDGEPLGGGRMRFNGDPAEAAQADDFESPDLAALTDPREGYPWLVPHHRRYSSGWQGEAPIYRLGLRWQSLVVSPAMLAGGQPPPVVPPDQRFRWWSRLRQVPSSWVTSRGETERFVYYDGPTRAAVPISVELAAPTARLIFYEPPARRPVRGPENDAESEPPFHLLHPATNPSLAEHEGLYIEVHGGELRGLSKVITSTYSSQSIQTMPLHGDAVINALRGMLTRYGLTAEEAEGLVAAWTPQFFQTEGRRFILRMSPEEYARQCPLQMRPAPTQLVRLGLVLTEFDPKPATTEPQDVAR